MMHADMLWQQVLARDSHAEGRFVYAVRSTRVYCRPTCPSRRPRREQVEFYSTPAEAESKGYRPCRRCAPKSETAAQMVARIGRELRGEPCNCDELAAKEGMPLRKLNQIFRNVLGVSVREYLASAKVESFKQCVQNSANVTDSIYEAGYGSSSRLYEKSNAVLGMTPATYGKGGRGARIRYGVRKTDLGYILLGATERGICAVQLGDSISELEKELRKQFPAASISCDDAATTHWLDAIASHIEGRGFAPDLPLDICATAFQARVWQALRQTKPGQTLSYRELAERVGMANGARAVAAACAKNPVAITIPCHRIIGSDGALTGYRWGVQRKRAILAAEKGGSSVRST